MQYRTIVLGLIHRHSQTYQQLCNNRRLLPTADLYAEQLRATHQDWKGRLAKANPDCSPLQLDGESLELAIRDLENYLVAHFQANESDPVSLDTAMAFIRRRTQIM